MSSTISTNALWKWLDRNPKNPHLWTVVPALIGRCPLYSDWMLVDFQWRPIAQREGRRTRILAPDNYLFLKDIRFIDDIEFDLFGGVRELPRADRMIDEWGLAPELYRRAVLLERGELPFPRLPSD